MDLTRVFDFFLHVDEHLRWIIQTYHSGTYAILFGVIFCETGLVVFPFLPGDSLLFLTGVYAQKGELNAAALFLLLSLAALCGDNVNYFLGRTLGPRIFRNEKSRLFNRKHLERTHAFFERYGGKTIILARFVPIVRTFAPFVAGMGRMTYQRFIFYSVAGASLWVGLCVFAGFFFARSPLVKRHFGVALVSVVVISMLPGIIEFTKHWLRARHERRMANAPPAEPAPLQQIDV